jgi:hypothetical protein
MNRKLPLTLMIVLLISLFAASPVLADKTYRADRFDVHIDLQGNGSAIVTETIEFYFVGGDFTYAFRDVSATETDGVTFIEASMDGVTMPQGTQAGQVEVEAGDPLKVTWHFPPISGAAHVFVLRYRADGLIRKGDADTLIWRAIPQEHEYSIARSTITLTYPTKATMLGQPTLSRSFESASTGNRFTLTSSGLDPNEDLILTARFAPNSVTQITPHWQANDAAASRTFPVGLWVGIATLVLGGFGLFAYIRANARELNLPMQTLSLATPPADVPPALVGKLTGYEAYSSMGAIFSLAQRGALEIVEEKGFLGAKNHFLERKEVNFSLNPHEQGLLDAIFKTGETRVSMSEISTRLAGKKNFFYEPLEQELIQRGWLDPERKRKDSILSIVGILTMVVALLVFIFSMVFAGILISSHADWLAWVAAAAGISIGVFFLSIALLIYAGTFSVLTPAGEEQSARWKGFSEYLKQVSKGKEPAISPDYFERYLAYAAAFGLGANWAKYFQKFGGAPLPVWFHAMPGSDGDFGAIVAVMSASDSAGASAGGDGGGSASGGGSSGAG